MFNTFIKDSYENANAQIREFKHYIEIVQNTKIRESSIDERTLTNDKETTL